LKNAFSFDTADTRTAEWGLGRRVEVVSFDILSLRSLSDLVLRCDVGEFEAGPIFGEVKLDLCRQDFTFFASFMDVKAKVKDTDLVGPLLTPLRGRLVILESELDVTDGDAV
jgi:hypothetical protein